MNELKYLCIPHFSTIRLPRASYPSCTPHCTDNNPIWSVHSSVSGPRPGQSTEGGRWNGSSHHSAASIAVTDTSSNWAGGQYELCVTWGKRLCL